jgi:putative phosphoribosyl transferase
VRVVPWFPPLYDDRPEGGRALAGEVAALALEEPVVVGVARGGVAVAVEVARALGAPLTAVAVERVIVRGLPLGAVTAAGPAYVPEDRRIPEEELRVALERARRAAEILEVRLGHDPPQVAAGAAVVVDDGVVTGLTLAAACRWARSQEVARLVAATPVGHVAGLARLRAEADDVVCPSPLEEIAVVGQAYESFEPLEEWYVAGLLAQPRQRE